MKFTDKSIYQINKLSWDLLGRKASSVAVDVIKSQLFFLGDHYGTTETTI